MSGYSKEIREIIDKTYHPIKDKLINRSEQFLDDSDVSDDTYRSERNENTTRQQILRSAQP